MVFKSVRKVRRITHVVLAKTVKALIDGPVTAHEISDITGIRLPTAGEWMRCLRKEGCVHISGWLPDTLGRDATAVYQLGKGKDKPRSSMSGTEKSRRYRARKRQREIQSIITGVNHDTKRTIRHAERVTESQDTRQA